MSKCQKVEHDVSQDEVQPWHRLGGMEHICELRKTSSVIYGILVTILRMLYSGKKGRTFGCPNVIWKQDAQKTQIWIDTELRWEDARPDFRPAIYVCLGEIKYDLPPTVDGQGRIAIAPDGEYKYERTGTATASIVHVCDTVGAACALADNTESYLSSLQGEIADQYCFEHFIVTGRVPRQKASEQAQAAGRDKIASVVQVQFDWADAWMVKVESPILKSVDVFPVENGTVAITGTNVDLADGQIEIEFGDLDSEMGASVAK
jgi:hypothetical protein